MPLINTYTNLDAVRRVLRASASNGRIKFSDSYSILRSMKDNTGNIELVRIGISKSYADVANYNIVFQGDETSFKMYKTDTEKQTDYIVGSGVKQQDFTTFDGFFSIDSTYWSGVAVGGDRIEFMTDSHISYDDASSFIQDAEYFVDSILEKNIRFTSTSEASLRFPLDSTSQVPKAIQLASSRIAAYMICKSIYLDQHVVDEKEDVYSRKLLREGVEVLGSYVHKWNLALSTSAPLIGHAGSNQPADLESDYVFQGSEFNLYLPILRPLNGFGEVEVAQKGLDFVGANNFSESVNSDIAYICGEWRSL